MNVNDVTSNIVASPIGMPSLQQFALRRPAWRVHCHAVEPRVVSVPAPDRIEQHEHQPRQQGGGDAGTGPAERRNRSGAVHEDRVQRNLQRERGKIDRHRDLGADHCGVERDEHAGGERGRQADRDRMQVVGCDSADRRLDACEGQPGIGGQQYRQSRQRQCNRQPERLLHVVADRAPVACAKVMAGHRRQRLQHAH
jgi:hypothetical protein